MEEGWEAEEATGTTASSMPSTGPITTSPEPYLSPQPIASPTDRQAPPTPGLGRHEKPSVGNFEESTRAQGKMSFRLVLLAMQPSVDCKPISNPYGSH